MKIMIMNAYDENRIPELVQLSIRDRYIKMGEDVTYNDLNQMNISSCQGCFNCWLKTPGECILKDDGIKIAKSYIQSDLVVLVTPVSFGCYSPKTKRALERCIPLLSPFFTKINGEYHHKKRYKNYPNIVVIGILEEADSLSEELLFQQVKRNALNFFCQDHSCILIYEHQCNEEIDEILNCLFNDTWREAIWTEK